LGGCAAGFFFFFDCTGSSVLTMMICGHNTQRGFRV